MSAPQDRFLSPYAFVPLLNGRRSDMMPGGKCGHLAGRGAARSSGPPATPAIRPQGA